ncbi:uncharacterized protein LOC128312595 [Acinonyx jubatus]|uniref:Uncharacterized protein LOC128312595 n=1 Tax=Acinonyx jubatus TaxID=32536 RepID=A0ABM3NUP6_ACIJB|nr:uncharacterized protein LOC128312595 [Acinonyx jubatus]
MRMRGRGANGVSHLPGLFSRVSNHAPVLRLQPSATPRFLTVRDQAPGSTSLPSSVSDVAVFPGPLLLKDRGSDPFRPLREGLTQQWRRSNGRVSATLRNACWTLLLPVPETAAGCRPPQKKFARWCSRCFSGMMETHNMHLAPGFTLNEGACSSPSECGRFLGSAGTRGLQPSPPSVLPAVEPFFPVWPENLPDPTLLLGIRPSHQSTASPHQERQGVKGSQY